MRSISIARSLVHLSKTLRVFGFCLLLPGCWEGPPTGADAPGPAEPAAQAMSPPGEAERFVFRALWVLCEGSARRFCGVEPVIMSDFATPGTS